MKAFLLTIIVVWTTGGGERMAGSQEIQTHFPTAAECMAELEKTKKELPESFQSQGATNVEVFGRCEMWGKPGSPIIK
jgi:hypothetical protein